MAKSKAAYPLRKKPQNMFTRRVQIKTRPTHQLKVSPGECILKTRSTQFLKKKAQNIYHQKHAQKTRPTHFLKKKAQTVCTTN